jgi:hypothetical protein
MRLEHEVAELTQALGAAHVELRILRRGGAAGFPSRSWELMRAPAGLSLTRFCELAGVPRATW